MQLVISSKKQCFFVMKIGPNRILYTIMAGARLCPPGDYKVLRSMFDKCTLSVHLLQDPCSEGVAADDEVFTPRKCSLQQKITLKYMPSASNHSDKNGALRVRYGCVTPPFI